LKSNSNWWNSGKATFSVMTTESLKTEPRIKVENNTFPSRSHTRKMFTVHRWLWLMYGWPLWRCCWGWQSFGWSVAF